MAKRDEFIPRKLGEFSLLMHVRRAQTVDTRIFREKIRIFPALLRNCSVGRRIGTENNK